MMNEVMIINILYIYIERERARERERGGGGDYGNKTISRQRGVNGKGW